MRSVLSTIALVMCTTMCFAWGADGHRMVAEVAMHYLSATAKENVLKILQKTTPEEAATWMDDMRNNDYYKYMQHWHYIDIPKDSVYTRGQGDNLIAALNTAFNDLKKKSGKKEKRKEDLLIIFHLIGDMAQPLHTGYPEDKGGNDVEVSYKGSGSNLHHVWDNDIIESEHITIDTCLALAATWTPQQIRAIISGNFMSWMMDSRSYLPQVYDYKGNKVDEAYVAKNKMLVEHQIVAGGLRLAHVLEVLFGNEGSGN